MWNIYKSRNGYYVNMKVLLIYYIEIVFIKYRYKSWGVFIIIRENILKYINTNAIDCSIAY